MSILNHIDITQVIIAAVTTIGGALFVWYRKKLIAWKRFWSSVLDGLRSIPRLEADIKGIRYYVAPNGGGSLMDTTRRTEAAVAALTDSVDLLAQTMLAENDVDDIGRFYCNGNGENTYVNRVYARMLGVGKAELLGWSFLNFIHPEDIDEVRQQWIMARSEHRQYHFTHRMIAADDTVIRVEVISTPIPEQAPAKRWIGTIRRIE